MWRTRIAVLGTSVLVLLLFGGMLMAGRDEEEDLFRSLGNLAEVVHLVLTEYVDELNEEALSLSLDAGIVESIDPFAAVLPAESVDAYRELLQLPPAYGLALSSRLGSAAARHVMVGSPADRAGLEQWEVIERVEGVNTRGRPLWQVRLELAEHERRGETVTLTVVDSRVDERREVALEPASWTPVPAEAEEKDDAQVLVVHSLPQGAAAAIRELTAARAPEIVDLRQLVWGFEEEAVATADLFVADGVLGLWRGKRAGEQSFKADPEVVTSALPLVLVGPETEGVGEILAAALQRTGATLVGHPTAGHAPHMQLINDGDIHLWIPVAFWLRADDQPIDSKGLEPDELVAPTTEVEGADPVLERALELRRVRLDEAA